MGRSRKRQRVRNRGKKSHGNAVTNDPKKKELPPPKPAAQQQFATLKAAMTAAAMTAAASHKRKNTFEESSEDDGQDEEASEHGSNSSYISKPRDSDDDSEAAYNRYQQRQDDRYLAKQIERQQELDRKKELEVQKAYSTLVDATKVGERIAVGPLRDEGSWDLYSSEYHSHYFEPVHLSKRISFGNIYDDIPGFTPCGADEIAAELHIYPEAHLDFEPFTKPAYASLEPVKIRAVQGAEVDVTFLGNGYLKMRVDLDALLGKGKPKPVGTRAVSYGYRKNSRKVEFVGIWKSNEERKRERDEWRCRNQPPSPKDSMAARMNNYW